MMTDESIFHRMKTDGTEKSKLASFPSAGDINIVEDGNYQIIYVDYVEKGLTEVARAMK